MQKKINLGIWNMKFEYPEKWRKKNKIIKNLNENKLLV